jgi:hypothetical protein
VFVSDLLFEIREICVRLRSEIHVLVMGIEKIASDMNMVIAADLCL